MAGFGLAPITIVMGGQTTVIAVTDTSGVALPIYLDSSLATLITQPYRVTGEPSLTVFHPLSAATEQAVISALIEGEPAARKTVTLLAVTPTLVTLAAGPGSVAAPSVSSIIIDGGTLP